MQINYEVIYSTKRKRLSLCIERDKSIKVYAPKGVDKKEIEKAIESKKSLLYKKLNKPLKESASLTKEYVSGESFLYLGRNYQLEITKDNKRLYFFNRFYLGEKNKNKAKELFQEWYRKKAKEKITPLIDEYAKNMGLEYNNIRFSKIKYRWGSCNSKGNMNFNLNLIKAPQFVIRYVIVHELAHLRELNHSSKFWLIVKTQLPKYIEAKNWLRENGEKLL